MKQEKINENLEWVGMSNCFICGEPKELLLDRRMKKTLPKEAVYNKEPCEKCLKVMGQGIFLIGVREGETGENPYRTGQIIGIKEESIKKMINEPLLSDILKRRVCFIEENVLVKMGLIDENKNLKYEKEFEDET